MSASEARRHALEARDAIALEATGRITYSSAGKVIALGDEQSLAHCDELPAGIEVQRVVAQPGKVEVDGYLGAFTVRVEGEQPAAYRGDAVLDLGAQPLLARELPPPGYFHAPPERRDLPALAAELESLSGEFDKPRYFDYDPSICAHGVNGKIACRRCIDACPAGAIESHGDSIEVNPFLCQGGGSCSTVCPSGAIRYRYPGLRDNGKRLRDMLRAYREAGGERPVVMFHAQVYAPDDYLEHYDNLLPIAVEELASVGMDLCLSALAYGALQVVLLVDSEVPASSRQTLQDELGWLHPILGALGLGSASVVTCEADAAIPGLEHERAIEPALHDMPEGKRNAIFRALDHLVAELRPEQDRIDLPWPGPFGEAIIDAEKCTLCMACVGACPGRALQDGSNREVPEVFFVEANCLQCGGCVQTCPEDAIRLAPRMLFEHDNRVRGRTLNRDAPFACIVCGKPFAPTSVINKMQDRLKDHHMFGSERALNRLKMCDACRVADVVQDPEAMGGQFDPLKGFRQ